MNSDDLIIIGMLAGSTAFTGAIAYWLGGRDLKGTGRVSMALVSAVLVGLTSLLVPYLPVLAFLATALIYLVVRNLLKPGLALAASAVVFLGGLACAVLLMGFALSSM
ncbi:hypothetical protein [Spirillospora sp. NPDC029432]|uniref:hypothetical protein n=1 Tax=Spirillospora sp. NPDC029432 TaxID=3154599 RepID=UPI003456838E